MLTLKESVSDSLGSSGALLRLYLLILPLMLKATVAKCQQGLLGKRKGKSGPLVRRLEAFHGAFGASCDRSRTAVAGKRRCSCDGGKISWKLIRTIGRAGGWLVCWHALNPRTRFSLSGLAEAGPVEPPLCQIQASRARRSSHLQPAEPFLSAAHKQKALSRTSAFRADSRVETRAAIAGGNAAGCRVSLTA